MSKINWKDKCWVTTIFLLRDDDKVLLTWNKNLQTWIPVGGHIDEGETPDEAIKREVAEELGFPFSFFGSSLLENGGKVKVLSFHRFQIEEVSHHNKHMNFIFFGKVLSFNKEKVTTDEDEKLKWFSEEEINTDPVMLDSVRKVALEAIAVYKNEPKNNSKK